MLMVLLSMLRDEPILIFASSSHIIAIFVLHFGFVVGGRASIMNQEIEKY